MLGEERRHELLKTLKASQSPITGTDLAKIANVSRQVIVNDMTLLKARNEPILATSQGYVYITAKTPNQQFERIIACQHTVEQNEDELMTLVDCGVTVKNVIVQHPLYGELTASILVSNRHDVENFVRRSNETNAKNLAELTGGTHLHTLVAPSIDILDRAEQAMRDKGYLIEEK